MKKISLILTIAVCLVKTHASAQSTFNSGILNIDFYNPSLGQSSAYGPGAGVVGSSGDYWNGLNSSQIINATGLKDNSGNTTTVGYEGIFSGGQSFIGAPALLAPDVPIKDSTNIITGLTADAQYNLYLYDANGDSGIYVNGTHFTWTGGFPNYSLSQGAGFNYNVETVTADANGDLNITSANQFDLISALQLTPVATPEPSTLALAGLGAASLLAIRRRK